MNIKTRPSHLTNLPYRDLPHLGSTNLQDWTRSRIEVSQTHHCSVSIQLMFLFSTLAIDNDPDCMVSRNHCEFYVVMYEPTINHIFVRDRKSCNGTWVNGHLIGSVPKISPGYLLRDGDVVEIRPFWKFVVAQDHSPPRTELTSLQSRECEVSPT